MTALCKNPDINSVSEAFRAGDHAAALALAGELLNGDFKADEWKQLAAVLSEYGQNPHAARAIARACETAPMSPELMSNLAQFHWMAGETNEAVAILRRTVEVCPQLPGLWVQLGMVLLTAGRHLDAFMAYATAHSIHPDEGRALLGRACAFRLLSNQREVSVRLGGIDARFAVSGRSVSVDFMHLQGKFYEEAELAAVSVAVPAGGVIADVGANLGNHAVFFLRALGPRELHLFEPNPACVKVLGENLALNARDDTPATIHEQGVGAQPGELFFNQHDDLNNGLVPVADGAHARRVPIVTLDETLERVDFIKIDVEGMELDVLTGARRLLQTSRPRLFVEVQERNRHAFQAALNEYGYTVFRAFEHEGYANIIAGPAAAA